MLWQPAPVKGISQDSQMPTATQAVLSSSTSPWSNEKTSAEKPLVLKCAFFSELIIQFGFANVMMCQSNDWPVCAVFSLTLGATAWAHELREPNNYHTRQWSGAPCERTFLGTSASAR